MFNRIVIAAALSAAAIVPAQAGILTGSYGVIVSEGRTTGPIDSTTNPNFMGSGTAAATFTYTGPINFSNTALPVTNATGDLNSTFGFSTTNISAYMGSGTVTASNGNAVADFSSVGKFLTSSGSSAVFQYASYYQFDLGVVAAGTVLTIRHDDGAAVYQGNTRIGNTVTGATVAMTDTVRINTTADTILRYTRQNSTPSILQVSVPEPMSIALLGAGLAGIGLSRRRRQA